MTARDKRLCHDVPYHVACDRLETLIRWCRDPIIAETQEGNEGFWDAVRLAEIALEHVAEKTPWTPAE